MMIRVCDICSGKIVEGVSDYYAVNGVARFLPGEVHEFSRIDAHTTCLLPMKMRDLLELAKGKRRDTDPSELTQVDAPTPSLHSR